MSEASNPTPGIWYSDGCVIYALKHSGWSKGEEEFENTFYAKVQAGRSESNSDAATYASLFAEAGTVHHETGLTPRQLVEQRDALADALIGLRHAWDNLGQGEGESVEKAHSALALVKGGEK